MGCGSLACARARGLNAGEGGPEWPYSGGRRRRGRRRAQIVVMATIASGVIGRSSE